MIATVWFAFSFFIYSKTLISEMALPTFKVALPTPIYPIQKLSHRHAQRFAFKAIFKVNLIKMTVHLSHHMEEPSRVRDLCRGCWELQAEQEMNSQVHTPFPLCPIPSLGAILSRRRNGRKTKILHFSDWHRNHWGPFSTRETKILACVWCWGLSTEPCAWYISALLLSHMAGPNKAAFFRSSDFRIPSLFCLCNESAKTRWRDSRH